jgi:hypothetical protein
MAFGPRGELHRKLSESEEWGLLALWHKGLDTYDISIRLGIHECEVANRLMHLRQLAKLGGRFDALRAAQ